MIRKIILICCGLVVVSCSPRGQSADAKNTSDAAVIPAQKLFRFGQTGFPKISAHRGGRGIPGYPENCLQTFQYVHEATLSIIECDVALSADGVIILMHDDNLDRTTTGTGPVDESSFQDMQNLWLEDDFGQRSNYKIPTLESVLQWGKEAAAYFTIDFKKTVPYEAVIDLIEAEEMIDQCILISYSAKQAEKLHQLSPRSMISVSMRNDEEVDRMLNSNLPTDRMIAFTGTRRKKGGALFNRIHQLGVLCMFGSLGNIDKQAEVSGDNVYLDLYSQGIDIMATDLPLAVFEILD